MRKKIIPFIDFEDFKIIDEESDAIYLTWDEIIRIYRLNLSDFPHLTKYSDLFVLGRLSGLRFSNFSTIKPEDSRGKCYTRSKINLTIGVVIPLRDEAYNISRVRGRMQRRASSRAHLINI